MDRKNHKLSRVQDAKLVIWIDQHAKELERERPTREKVVERAAKELQIPELTIWHVTERMRAAGIRYQGRGDGTGAKQMQRAATRVLASAVMRLYRELGSQAPSDLVGLVETIKRGDELISRMAERNADEIVQRTMFDPDPGKIGNGKH